MIAVGAAWPSKEPLPRVGLGRTGERTGSRSRTWRRLQARFSMAGYCAGAVNGRAPPTETPAAAPSSLTAAQEIDR